MVRWKSCGAHSMIAIISSATIWHRGTRFYFILPSAFLSVPHKSLRISPPSPTHVDIWLHFKSSLSPCTLHHTSQGGVDGIRFGSLSMLLLNQPQVSLRNNGLEYKGPDFSTVQAWNLHNMCVQLLQLCMQIGQLCTRVIKTVNLHKWLPNLHVHLW